VISITAVLGAVHLLGSEISLPGEPRYVCTSVTVNCSQSIDDCPTVQYCLVGSGTLYEAYVLTTRARTPSSISQMFNASAETFEMSTIPTYDPIVYALITDDARPIFRLPVQINDVSVVPPTVLVPYNSYVPGSIIFRTSRASAYVTEIVILSSVVELAVPLAAVDVTFVAVLAYLNVVGVGT
jgi:hypothetical protein